MPNSNCPILPSERITRGLTRDLSRRHTITAATGDSLDQRQGTRSTPRLSNRQKVDDILRYMREEYRWSIKDLMFYMVTEDAEVRYTATKEKRANDIAKALFEQPNVRSAIFTASTGFRDIQIDMLARSFRDELGLRNPGSMGQFDPNKDPRQYEIQSVIEQSKKELPSLWRFLESIVGERSSPERLDGALFMVCEIMAHSKTPRKNNAFHILIGIHLHSKGVKGRVINTLAGLGVGVSYETVRKYLGIITDISKVRQRTISGLDYSAN